MESLNHIGSCEVENFVAAIELVAPEIVSHQRLVLQPRPCCTVEDDNALAHGIEVAHRDVRLRPKRDSDVGCIASVPLSKRSWRPKRLTAQIYPIDQALAPCVIRRLPRLRRACPSTAQDERSVKRY